MMSFKKPALGILIAGLIIGGVYAYWRIKNQDSDTVKITGTVTSVFTDCHKLLTLEEDGKVKTSPATSCDGGSYITVDNQSINTASGLTRPEHSFNKHDSDLQPGANVTVTAINDGENLTLNCADCKIQNNN